MRWQFSILERFPGYTLSSLRAESSELLRLLEIERRGGGRDQYHRDQCADDE